MELRIKGTFGGYARERFYTLTDGSKWQQIDPKYEWRFAHRPTVTINGDQMMVKGMKNSVKVRRIA